MQRWATVATTPSTTSSATAFHVSATQVNGAITKPNSSAAAICTVTSTVSEVPRTRRVQTSSSAKEMLPAMAISAGQEKLCADGLSAIMTPAKPTITAEQRRQPTCSLAGTARWR